MATSTSPVPNKKESKDMGFLKAFAFVMEGQKISRREWGSDKIFGYMNDGLLSLRKPDGKNYQWIVSDGDTSAQDWFVL